MTTETIWVVYAVTQNGGMFALKAYKERKCAEHHVHRANDPTTYTDRGEPVSGSSSAEVVGITLTILPMSVLE